MHYDEIFYDRPETNDKHDSVAMRIIIEGRVQKVGLRHWVKQMAVKHSVTGWVRNRMNSSVEALFYGSKPDVNTMLELCQKGPSFAHIRKMKQFPQSDLENIPPEFSILPTI